MKAITAVCATGASVPAVVNGRVSRQRDGENAEIKMYLSKLKDLVPFMPKNRKLSKLEIIQHVIDYICDLQSELETHPAVSNFDAAAALNEQQQHQLQQQISTSSEQLSHLNHLSSNIQQQECSHNTTTTTLSTSPHQHRQPLCVRPSPNTILSTSPLLTTPTTHSNPISGQQTHHITINSSSYSHTTTDKTNPMERPHC